MFSWDTTTADSGGRALLDKPPFNNINGALKIVFSTGSSDLPIGRDRWIPKNESEALEIAIKERVEQLQKGALFSRR